ncbi:lysine transporter LysE [Loktanella sp. 1ANDIMAR09]|uniref:LysE family translocator n=1 Tax=Loktanella sp. 5RATIMAR09 TaxID=1225655 RepID=UPI0006DCC67E|nr:LysE family translocator [Loktanella sp. 5RATIMAR09]KQB96567.1 lysine transporter LysE [Loktanella sp. 1ANDIMAR09]KQI73595.1 lysine transporter LysE [Loktanella sp. 5RATIMAR09]
MADLLPLIGFVFFGLFSPGPNVILITTSGARFGFQRTLPHIIGVALGVGIIAAVTGIGIGALITAQPALGGVLKIIASVWILWMAYNLWRADPLKRRETDRPFTFLQAILFQWVNPKVWVVALSATAYVATLAPVQQALTLAATFSSLNLGVCIFWAMAGSLLAYLLKNPAAWRIFMRVMALALAGFSVLLFL